MAYAGKAGLAKGLRPLPNSVSYNESRPIGAVATGLAVGLLLGAGVALLFAPGRGSDTRRGLRRGLRQAGLRSRDAWADLRIELRHAGRRYRRARRRGQLVAQDGELID